LPRALRIPSGKYLDDESFKLYQLIWQRFVASQMVPAVFDQTTIDVAAGDYIFRASGSVEKFAGFLAAYRSGEEDMDKEDDAEAEGKRLPRVTENEILKLAEAEPSEAGATTLPVRFGTTFHRAASSIHRSDFGEGPGRKRNRTPFHLRRDYFHHRRPRIRHKGNGQIHSTMLGAKVSVLLVKGFEDIFDLGFTARMEEELDEVEEGKLPWKQAVGEFTIAS